jgi:hypothetical protein
MSDRLKIICQSGIEEGMFDDDTEEGNDTAEGEQMGGKRRRVVKRSRKQSRRTVKRSRKNKSPRKSRRKSRR